MFSEIFNELLDERGINRKHFAEQCCIPYTTVIGWTNAGRLPDFNALIKIANFFECSIDYLAGREDEFGNKINASKYNLEATSQAAEQENDSGKLTKLYHKLSDTDAKLLLSIALRLNRK